ncbi:MAG: hypothetical protein AAGF11_56640 [Myxococcota bacterium]
MSSGSVHGVDTSPSEGDDDNGGTTSGASETATAGETTGNADETTAGVPSAPGIFPPPPGLEPSAYYAVQLVDADGIEHDSFVYLNEARVVDSGGNHGADRQAGRSMSWTTFTINEPTTIRVTRLAGGSGGVLARPSHHDIAVMDMGDGVVELEVEPGQKLSLEYPDELTDCYYGFTECIEHALMIFADQTEPSPLAGYPDAMVYEVEPGTHADGLVNELGDLEGRPVVRFKPGVHDIGYWQVPNSVDHVHLDGGAYVRGAIDVVPMGPPPDPDDYQSQWADFELREDFTLTGHGVLSGSTIPWHTNKFFEFEAPDSWWRFIRLLQLSSAHVTLRDVTLVDSPYWTISFTNDDDPRTEAVMENFKIVGGWTYNNDGLPLPEGLRSRVADCFVHANDDAFKIYNSGSTVENCVVWQSENGASFQLGWFPKSIENVTVRDIDIIHSESWYHPGNNLGVVNYANAGGTGTIANLTFSELRVEGNIMRVLGLAPAGGQIIQDIQFEGLRLDQLNLDPQGEGRFNYIDTTGGADVTNVRFVDFQIGGELVLDTTAAKLSGSGLAGAVSFE